MARVEFTSHLRQWAPEGVTQVPGARVGDVLSNLFEEHRLLRGYVLDDQGRLRKHVCIFVDGVRLIGAQALEAETNDSSEIYVMQALSGG